MLLLVTGASGAGKSMVLPALERVEWPSRVRCAEFDSIGVPPDADTAWRHGAIESWVRRALDAQAAGEHLVLCGQVPLGELLAAPSAELVDGVAVCTLDCSPTVREQRLRGRGDPAETIPHHVAFGEWFRGHMADPRFHPEVVRLDSSATMRWERWERWQKGDPRWAAETIVTDQLTPAEVAQRVTEWALSALTHRDRGVPRPAAP